MKEKVKIIAAVSEVLNYRNKKQATKEELIGVATRMISREKNNNFKLGMIAAASRAADLIERDFSIKDKEILGIIVKEMPKFVSLINEEDFN